MVLNVDTPNSPACRHKRQHNGFQVRTTPTQSVFENHGILIYELYFRLKSSISFFAFLSFSSSAFISFDFSFNNCSNITLAYSLDLISTMFAKSLDLSVRASSRSCNEMRLSFRFFCIRSKEDERLHISASPASS